MKPIVCASVIILIEAAACWAQDFQKLAEETPFKFSEEQASITHSFKCFPNEYQIELIRPQNKFGAMTLRIVKDGKQAFAFEGNRRTVFVAAGDVLVYADLLPTRTGCTLIAFDLKQKKLLWKTPLRGLGPIDHFQYANAVNLELVHDNAAARVFGRESAGRYVEFVDLKTGKTVGHHKYVN